MPLANRDLLGAIEDADVRPRYALVFGLIALLLVCELFDYFVVGYLVSAIAPSWGLTFGQTSLMLLSAGVGAIAGALAGGRLADRFGRKHVLLGAAMLVCAGAGSLAFVPEGNWLAFTALRLVVGIGYGACGSTQFALICGVHASLATHAADQQPGHSRRARSVAGLVSGLDPVRATGLAWHGTVGIRAAAGGGPARLARARVSTLVAGHGTRRRGAARRRHDAAPAAS